MPLARWLYYTAAPLSNPRTGNYSVHMMSRLSAYTWYGVYFIQDHEAPFLSFEPLHHPLSLPGPFGGVGPASSRCWWQWSSLWACPCIGGKAADLAVADGGPHLELGFPLLHRHSWVAQHQTALPDGTRSCHANQGLPSTYKTPRATPPKLGWNEGQGHRQRPIAPNLAQIIVNDPQSWHCWGIFFCSKPVSFFTEKEVCPLQHKCSAKRQVPGPVKAPYMHLVFKS